MRLATERFLSKWALGEDSIDLKLREFIEDIDWDDREMAVDERSVLLHVEAYIAGIDEGYSLEEDLRSYLTKSVRFHLLDTDDVVLVDSSTCNADLTEIWGRQLDLSPAL